MSGQSAILSGRSRKSFQFPGYILDLRTGTYLYVAPSPLPALPSFAFWGLFRFLTLARLLVVYLGLRQLIE